MLRIPKPQQNQSINYKDYANRVCVLCDMSFDDKKYFHSKLCEFIDDITGDVLFISGSQNTKGGESFIPQWCEKYKYPLAKILPKWDDYKKLDGESHVAGAVFSRNYDIVKFCTHLLYFNRKGVSKIPTIKHLLELCNDPDNTITTIEFLR